MLIEKNTCSSLLTLTIQDLNLHFLLFIEIQRNEFTLVKLDKIVNPTKNTFLTNWNIFITLCHFFHQIIVNIYYVININRRTHIYSKNHYILTKSAIWKLKTWFPIKSNSITRISIVIKISIFSQSNCTK